MKSKPDPAGFEALDACHRQMQLTLADLAELAARVEAGDVDAALAQRAAAIEAFFSDTAREHHADEEQLVFPPLLAGGKPEVVAAVRTLQQDHGWIEEDWLELSPQLRAIAAGDTSVDPVTFAHGIEIFHALCIGHIALEESLVYPEAKASYERALARRENRPVRQRG